MDSTKYAGIITSVLLVLASACSGTDGGTYQGKSLSGAFWETLFETGMYEKDTQRIAFSPKKQYDFETKQLVNLGISSQLPYFGMVTSETMIVTWYVIWVC